MEIHHPPSVPFDTGTSNQERREVKTEDFFKSEDYRRCLSREDDLSSSKQLCGRLAPGMELTDGFVSPCPSLDGSHHESSFSRLTEEKSGANSDDLFLIIDREYKFENTDHQRNAGMSKSNVCYSEETRKNVASVNHQERNSQQLSVSADKITIDTLMPGASDLKLCKSEARTLTTFDDPSNVNQTMSSMPNLEGPLLEMLNRTQHFNAKYEKACLEKDNLAKKLTETEEEKLEKDKELNRLQSVIRYLRSELVESGKIKIELPSQFSTANNSSNVSGNSNISTGSVTQTQLKSLPPSAADLDETKLIRLDNNSTKLHGTKDQDKARTSVNNSDSTLNQPAVTPAFKVVSKRTCDSERENKTIPGGDFHENGCLDDVCLLECPAGRSCNNIIALGLQRRQIANLEEALQVEKDRNKYLKSQNSVLKERFSSHNLNKNYKISESDGKSQETIVKALQTGIELLQHQLVVAVEDFEAEKSDKAKIVSSRRKLKENVDSLGSKLQFHKQQLTVSLQNLKEQTKKTNTLQQNIHRFRSEIKNKDQKISQLSEQLWYFQRLSAQQLPPFVQTPQPGVANSHLQNFKTKSPSNSTPKWPCDVCTYFNTEPRTVCEMCGKLKNTNFVRRSTRLVSRGLSTDEDFPINRFQFDPDNLETFSTHSE